MSQVHDATSLLRGRRRQRRTRRLVVGGAGLAVALVVVAGLWAVLFSSLFALRTVAVSGTQVLTPEQVQAAAGAPLGTPLARVGERPIAERVAGLPQVESVTVRRHFPHTLDVRVVERRPAYAVEADGRWLLVDAAGIAYLSVQERPGSLVQVAAPTNDPALLQAVAGVMAMLPPGMAADLESIEARSADTITLKLRGREVVLGSSADLDLKLQVAQALLQGTKAAWIDVSAPGHPATR